MLGILELFLRLIAGHDRIGFPTFMTLHVAQSLNIICHKATAEIS
jgi:hypothetical protein